jgi:uncharacterized membrane protein YbhN (UPF0104 family)
LGVPIDYLQSVDLLAALDISTAIPSTPGYVGVYQFVSVRVLEPFGVSRENALALILILQGLNIIAASALGGIGLRRIRGGRTVDRPPLSEEGTPRDPNPPE